MKQEAIKQDLLGTVHTQLQELQLPRAAQRASHTEGAFAEEGQHREQDFFSIQEHDRKTNQCKEEEEMKLKLQNIKNEQKDKENRRREAEQEIGKEDKKKEEDEKKKGKEEAMKCQEKGKRSHDENKKHKEGMKKPNEEINKPVFCQVPPCLPALVPVQSMLLEMLKSNLASEGRTLQVRTLLATPFPGG